MNSHGICAWRHTEHTRHPQVAPMTEPVPQADHELLVIYDAWSALTALVCAHGSTQDTHGIWKLLPLPRSPACPMAVPSFKIAACPGCWNDTKYELFNFFKSSGMLESRQVQSRFSFSRAALHQQTQLALHLPTVHQPAGFEEVEKLAFGIDSNTGLEARLQLPCP